MQAIDENGFMRFLCPPGEDGYNDDDDDDGACLINRETMKKFLHHLAFVRVTPATGHTYGHAKKTLAKRLQSWLRQPLEDGGTWGSQRRWNEWDGQRNPRKRGRGHPHQPPKPYCIYRSCGIQEIEGMNLLHMLTPFRRPSWTPEFWTPYRKVADIYGFHNSNATWVAAVLRLQHKPTGDDVRDKQWRTVLVVCITAMPHRAA